VDLDHGLVVEATGAVGSSCVEEVGVEALEVIGSQVPEGNPADTGTVWRSITRR